MLLLLLALACSPTESPADPVREALGVPAGARKVVVLGQSAHLDVDWLRTTRGYYEAYVEEILDRALDAIAADPAYTYSIAEMAYLRMYWEERPDRRDEVLAAMQSGRLRIVGGGVSSPDVLLPPGESLLRDYQQGIGWVRSVGGARTTAAWLPDDFGLGPTTPDLLVGAGFESVAFWRVDGHPDVPSFDASIADFDRFEGAPGSNAAILGAEEVTQWIWEGPGGGRVFAHWLYGGYMLGDYLDYDEIPFRLLGRPAGVPLEDLSAIADNLATAVAILEPRTPTDFLFVPVGGDFQYPKERLAEIARWWNGHRFADTGVWALSGAFDDYAALVGTQQDRLEVRRMDLTPYWMGFFASRPALKEEARLASSSLATAEMIDAMRRAAGLSPGPSVDAWWWTIGRSDHHDWITGTSLDDVASDEQLPEVRAARAAAEAAIGEGLDALAAAVDSQGPAVLVVDGETAPRHGWIEVAMPVPDGTRSATLTDGAVTVDAQVLPDGLGAWVPGVSGIGWRTFAVSFSTDPPGPGLATCLVAGAPAPCDVADAVAVAGEGWSAVVGRDGLHSWVVSGRERLAAPGPRLVQWVDGGGFYGFGHEAGGQFAPVDVARSSPSFTVSDGPLATTIAVSWTLGGSPVTEVWTFRRDDPAAEVAITLTTPRRRSVLAEWDVATTGVARARMAVPVGVVDREPGTRFAPQFAPFEEWFALDDDEGSLTIVAPANPAVTWTADGHVGLVLQRNAPTSMIEGHMTDDAPVTVRLRLDPTCDDTAARYATAAALWRPLRAAFAPGGGDVEPSRALVRVDPAARATALIPRDDHVVLRLVRPEAGADPVRVRTDLRGPATVTVTDATEGPDGAVLDVDPADMTLPLDAAVTTLRLR